MTVPTSITCVQSIHDFCSNTETTVLDALTNVLPSVFCCIPPPPPPPHDDETQNRKSEPTTFTAKQTSWAPPLFRNTSLLSSPSYDSEESSCVIIAEPSGSQRNRNTTANEDSSSSTTIDLPIDFIPPRHVFSSRISHQTTGGGGYESSASSTTTTIGKRVFKTISTNDFQAMRARSNDIVCGRGAPSNVHPGNKVFKTLVKEYEARYLLSQRSEKPRIAMELLDLVRSRGMRFVRRQKVDRGQVVWVEISEERAYEKVCQSLREGAPEIRRKMISPPTLSPNSSTFERRSPMADESTMTISQEREKENYTPLPFRYD